MKKYNNVAYYKDNKFEVLQAYESYDMIISIILYTPYKHFFTNLLWLACINIFCRLAYQKNTE